MRIVGHEDYEITPEGRVISFKSKKKIKELVRFKKPDGYLYVSLMKHGKVTQARVHNLVAKHFIPNPNNLPFVNHKDLNKENNHIDNLEWCTGRENVTHYRINKINKQEPVGVSKSDSKFRASIAISYKKAYLGVYDTEKEALEVYKQAVLLCDTYGWDAVLDFKKSLLYDRKASSKIYGVSFNSEKGRNQHWVAGIHKEGFPHFSKRCYTEDEAANLIIQKYKEYGIPLHYSHEVYLKTQLTGTI